MNLRHPAQIFLTEADDLLTQIEELALGLDPDHATNDLINPLFRAFHTLKGSGAMFGFDSVAEFTHHVETVLDQVREGHLALTEELISLLLRSKDHIKALLEAARNDQQPPLAAGAEIVAALNTFLAARQTAGQNNLPTDAANDPITPANGDDSPLQTFHIHFRPPPELMVAGTNPITLLNELRNLGDCQVTANTDRIPPLDQLRPDHCYFAWDIRLTTGKGLNAIKDVFMFVEDGSELKIELAVNPLENAAGQIPVAPTVPALKTATQERKAGAPPADKQPQKSSFKEASVRVPSERLDRLVNLVGELVMNQSRLSQVAALANVANLSAPVEELERLVDELRDNVLGIRMMPIGTTFSRFKRLVHDLSQELGKEIDLVTEGADTEMDKTVLDQLGDPLVHLIRNSIDHGIESPETRAGAGKPPRGTIRLAAAHVGSNVVITVADDGRGVDVEAVRSKAIEKGLISAEAKLSERDVCDLIFQPGFSTAKQVTNVSGRGVGMDVVKRQFEALRGQVALSSEAGKGTRITLTLPLTLAIIDGLLVEIGGDQFIVPMSDVTENVELHRSERQKNNGRNAIAVRGELVPYLRLRQTFGIAGEELEVEKIVIARHGDERIGLVVDRVLGSHQTVIQPMGRFYREVSLVSGATIMGDGRVALILDLGGLLRVAEEQKSQSAATVPSATMGHPSPIINQQKR